METPKNTRYLGAQHDGSEESLALVKAKLSSNLAYLKEKGYVVRELSEILDYRQTSAFVSVQCLELTDEGATYADETLRNQG